MRFILDFFSLMEIDLHIPVWGDTVEKSSIVRSDARFLRVFYGFYMLRGTLIFGTISEELVGKALWAKQIVEG